MTHIFILLSLLFIAVSGFLVGYGLVLKEEAILRRQRLGLARPATSCKSPMIRLLHVLIWFCRPLARRLYSNARFEAAESRLLCAGLETEISAEEYLSYKLVLPLVAFLFLLFLGGGHQGPWALAIAGSSYVFPDLWLQARRRLRQKAILSRLPFTIDLLTLSVEAGLDFGQALSEVSMKLGEGPLVDEIQKTLNQIRLGATRSRALADLARRVSLPEMSSLVAVLIQADRLGVGIGRALRAQSDWLRSQRFHRAEEMGAVAGQKILVPLILFILPAVVILIFGAVGLSMMGGGY